MNWNATHWILAMSPPPQSGTQANPAGEMMKTVGMMVLFFIIFYAVFIRPQQKKAKELEAKLKKLSAGDKIITSSGIVAEIITIKEKTITIRSADAKFEILKSAVAEVTEPKNSPAA